MTLTAPRRKKTPDSASATSVGNRPALTLPHVEVDRTKQSMKQSRDHGHQGQKVTHQGQKVAHQGQQVTHQGQKVKSGSKHDYYNVTPAALSASGSTDINRNNNKGQDANYPGAAAVASPAKTTTTQNRSGPPKMSPITTQNRSAGPAAAKTAAAPINTHVAPSEPPGPPPKQCGGTGAQKVTPPPVVTGRGYCNKDVGGGATGGVEHDDRAAQNRIASQWSLEDNPVYGCMDGARPMSQVLFIFVVL